MDVNDTTESAGRKAPEVWAIIPSFPDYAASTHGNIKRITTTLRNRKPSGRNLAPTPNSTGMYLSVSVCRDAKVYNRRVNRLVCEAFHGLPPSKIHHAAHIDGKSRNNTPDNLRWSLPVENEFDKRIHGTITTGERHWTFGREGDPVRGVDHGRAKLDDEKVRLIRADGGYQRDIAERFGVSQKTVLNIKKNRIWKHVK